MIKFFQTFHMLLADPKDKRYRVFIGRPERHDIFCCLWADLR